MESLEEQIAEFSDSIDTALKDLKIIVADDQEINITVLKSQFKTLGFTGTLHLCYNGDETLLTAK